MKYVLRVVFSGCPAGTIRESAMAYQLNRAERSILSKVDRGIVTVRSTVKTRQQFSRRFWSAFQHIDGCNIQYSITSRLMPQIWPIMWDRTSVVSKFFTGRTMNIGSIHVWIQFGGVISKNLAIVLKFVCRTHFKLVLVTNLRSYGMYT